MAPSKVVVVTGATSGLGLELVHRLLQAHAPELHICMTVRSRSKGDATIAVLRSKYRDAVLSLVVVDLSRPKEVAQAAIELRTRFSRIDVLYANAGMMPKAHIDFKAALRHVVRCEIAYMFETGGEIIVQERNTTADGIAETFASNVLGHYVLIHGLQEQLSGGRIVWTGSEAALRTHFSFDDVQCLHGINPYQSSKYAEEMLAWGVQLTFGERKRILSINTTPGTVLTGLSLPIIPDWAWVLVVPLLALVRLVSGSQTLTPLNGTEAMLWAGTTDLAKIDPRVRYNSLVRFRGTNLLTGSGGERYVGTSKLDVTDDEARRFMEILETMRLQVMRSA